jgi:hypothetical protein
MATNAQRLASGVKQEGGALPPVSFCTHVTSYLNTADGVADFTDAVQISMRYMQAFPLSDYQRGVVENVRGAASDAWSILVFPDIVAEGAKFFQKTGVFFESCYAGDYDNVGATAKNALLQGVDFTNTVSEGAIFLHGKNWIDIGANLPAASATYSVTSLISDGVDVLDQVGKLTQEPSVDKEPEEIAAVRMLAVIRLVKDVASILLAVISLTALYLGILVESVALLPPLILGLSTIFLVAKVTAYFYDKMLVEPTSASPAGDSPRDFRPGVILA